MSTGRREFVCDNIEYQRQTVLERYGLLCRETIESEPPPQYMPDKRGRPKRTKGRNLAERLMDKKEAVAAFAFNEGVPFSNNLVERDLKAAKGKTESVKLLQDIPRHTGLCAD